MRRISLIQSAYIPWRGFFDLVDRCDEYVIYDEAQFSKGHWHNRNRIGGPSGPAWLTIPVKTADRLGQAIEDVVVSDRTWAEAHWRKIESFYRSAPFLLECGPKLQFLFEAAAVHDRLTDINELMLRGLFDMLGVTTAVVRDRVYGPKGARTERVLDLCLKAGATHYLTGPSARSYLDETLFATAGIVVEWMNYPVYPAYPQQMPDYEPALSIIDLILNAGPARPDLWRDGGQQRRAPTSQ
jgi:hypothetical protein